MMDMEGSQWPNLDADLKLRREQVETEIATIFAARVDFHKAMLTVLKWFEFDIYEQRKTGHTEQAMGIKLSLDRFKKIASAKTKRIRQP